MSLLTVTDLHTHFITRDLNNRLQVARALNGVAFSLDRGETLGLVGETGAGKSLTAQSIAGLLRPPAKVVKGDVIFDSKPLLSMAEAELNAMRGNDIAMVVQNPKSSLDPLTRIGDQLIRLQRAHRNIGTNEARERALATLAEVGIPAPQARMRAWPHELSGGMAQRVLIAMALINSPKLLIADEPTTGLDVTVQAQILDLLRRLAHDRQMATLIITHDLGVVAHFCDRMAVMFAGAIVEQGPVRAVFARPAHPYTQSLISSTPERLTVGSGRVFGGAPPDLFALPQGCLHSDRCAHSTDVCRSAPMDVDLGQGHKALCHFAGEIDWAPA